MDITKAELRALVEECLQEEASANEEKLYTTIEIESYTDEELPFITKELDRQIKVNSYNEISYEIESNKVVITILPQEHEETTELKTLATHIGEKIIEDLEYKLEEDYEESLGDDDDYDYDKEFSTKVSYDIQVFMPEGTEVDDRVEVVNSVLNTPVGTMEGVSVKAKGRMIQVTAPNEVFYGYNGTPTGSQLSKNPNLIELDSETFESLKQI
jgi:hypothetical protein